jgi:hypothetical protein
MGRTKKPPVVWQDHHDEGAFRSTWTSQANPQLFNSAGGKTSLPSDKPINEAKVSDRNQAPQDNTKSDAEVPPDTMVKDSQSENRASSG